MEEAAPPGLVIVFVLDTSVSMNQAFERGLTCFDAAKAAIRLILKLFPEWHRDRNLQAALFTYGEEPFAFQSRHSADPNFNVFLEKLSKVRAHDAFRGDRALQAAYEYLHLFRMEYNLDTLGGGRMPWCNKPNIVCWLTDGEAIVRKEGLSVKFDSLPAETPGLQYFQNDFRWDQRLLVYYLNLRTKRLPLYIDEYARSRGGLAFHLTTNSDIRQRVDLQTNPKYLRNPSEVMLADPGMLVNFVDMDHPTDRGLNGIRLLSGANYRNRAPIFPFPENYWATGDIARLPVRETVPTVGFERGETPIIILPNYPFDKYLLQPCPITEEILRHEKTQYWPVNVLNSFSDPGKSFHFGFLTTNTNRTGVNLIVLGYNYPALFTLLQKPLSAPQRPIDAAWVNEIKTFLQYTPFYYHKTTLETLVRLGIHAFDPNDYTYADTEAMREIGLAATQAHERFCSRGYHLLPSALPKGFSSDLVRDALAVPRSKLLSTLHKQKYYFFECGRVEDASRIKEAIPANKRSMSIDAMQDYSAGETLRQRLRNPFDTDDDIKFKERTAFGNPYLKREDILPSNEPQVLEDQAAPKPSPKIGHHQAERRPRRRSLSPAAFDYSRIPRLRPIAALSDTEDDPAPPCRQARGRPDPPPTQRTTPTTSRDASPTPRPPYAREAGFSPAPPAPPPRVAPAPPRDPAPRAPASSKTWASIKSELISLVTCEDRDYDDEAIMRELVAIDEHPAYPASKKINLLLSIAYHAKARHRRGLQDFLDALIARRKDLAQSTA